MPTPRTLTAVLEMGRTNTQASCIVQQPGVFCAADSKFFALSGKLFCLCAVWKAPPHPRDLDQLPGQTSLGREVHFLHSGFVGLSGMVLMNF